MYLLVITSIKNDILRVREIDVSKLEQGTLINYYHHPYTSRIIHVEEKSLEAYLWSLIDLQIQKSNWATPPAEFDKGLEIYGYFLNTLKEKGLLNDYSDV